MEKVGIRKLYRVFNRFSIKGSLRVLDKKSASETSTRDPLYIGGVPRDVKLKGLDTQGGKIF
jgi:hypothetical protein